MDEFFDFDRAASATETATEGHRLPVSEVHYRSEFFLEDKRPTTIPLQDEIARDSGHSIKPGTKFSRASVRLLKNWLSSHHRYPYPTEEEKEDLKQKTGLNNTQIMNWLANARRKSWSRTANPISLVENNSDGNINIPRQATPAIEKMNPLDRWKNSPPETEPATAAAIAHAIKSSSFRPANDTVSDPACTSDSSWRAQSVNNESSTGSWEFSNSSRSSSASIISHGSGVSHRSLGSLGKRKARRRCRQPLRSSLAIRPSSPPRTFQCTFCTESFKAKYDWQRHEKSLHLSLERWICGLNGVVSVCEETKQLSCVYCGLANSNSDHIETHNHIACSERPIQERTFYRKDHLRQHLNLMHDAKFQIWSMSSWKVEMLNVRSRCGFCGITMDSWKVRADHLAHHFKSGHSMAEWQGNWGFETQILDLVENGIPPYLIHNERISLFPYKASNLIPKVQRTLYDLVKMGLIDFINDQITCGQNTTDNDLLQEACRICNTIDGVAQGVRRIGVSWFRDLLLLSARTSIQTETYDTDLSERESDFSVVSCPKESMLREFVDNYHARGTTPTDFELQTKACGILAELEAISSFPSEAALKWFCFLIRSSCNWLQLFKQRSNLSPSHDIPVESSISQTFSMVSQQEAPQTTTGEGSGSPTRTFQLVANPSVNLTWEPTTTLTWDLSHLDSITTKPIGNLRYNKPQNLKPFARKALPLYPEFRSTTPSEAAPTVSTNRNPPPWYLFSDANSFQRLKHELSRFVASCMSPSNPAQHVPTDDEIRNQARWIIFDDDDPWNQTAADNAGWLLAFKRDVGLASEGPE